MDDNTTEPFDFLGFLGKALFIPSVFVVTGSLIDPVALARGIADHLPLIIGILLARLIGKAVAAELVGRQFGYSPAERLTM